MYPGSGSTVTGGGYPGNGVVVPGMEYWGGVPVPGTVAIGPIHGNKAK